jgi:hypothetical protein
MYHLSSSPADRANYDEAVRAHARECLRSAATETPISTPVPTAPDKKGGMQR